MLVKRFLGGDCWRLLVVFPIITYMRTSWDSTRTVRSKSRMWQYPNILKVLRPRGIVLKSSWAVEKGGRRDRRETEGEGEGGRRREREKKGVRKSEKEKEEGVILCLRGFSFLIVCMSDNK